jgi:hypothetical protein
MMADGQLSTPRDQPSKRLQYALYTECSRWKARETDRSGNFVLTAAKNLKRRFPASRGSSGNLLIIGR